MPINYKNYPTNWKTEIRPRILKRANNCCEYCGLKNHIIGYRKKNGNFVEMQPATDKRKYVVINGRTYDLYEFLPNGNRLIQIVLTIAHLDHDVANHNVTDDRLAALCQQCHHRTHRIPKKERADEGVILLW